MDDGIIHRCVCVYVLCVCNIAYKINAHYAANVYENDTL